MLHNEFEKFIDSLELIDQKIPSFTWSREDIDINPEKTALHISLKSTKLKIRKAYFEAGNILEFSGKSIDNDKILFSIKGVLILKFSKKKEFDSNLINTYIEKTLPFSTIPAFRLLVRDALEKMNLPPFTLPLWKTKMDAKEVVNFDENPE